MIRNKKRMFSVGLALALLLVFVIPVAAGSGGTTSGRTTTVMDCNSVCSGGTCSYTGSMTYSGSNYFCTLNISTSATQSSECPTSGLGDYFSASACGWPVSGASSISQTGYACTTYTTVCTPITVSQPNATINSSLSGGTTGSNGWYTSGPTVNISASEPIAGESILGIEGTSDGVPFYCGGGSCNIAVSGDGTHTMNYRAISSWGDKTSYGDRTVQIDGETPTVNGSISGSVGDNGWYVSAVTLTPSGTDGVSGIDALEVQVDGGVWAPNTSIINSDGNHTAIFRSRDVAGNENTTASSAFKVDLTAPSVALTSHGASIQTNGTLNLSGTASDATSGLADVELSLDGGGSWFSVGTGATWSFAWDTTATADGTYAIELKATDNAGHVTQLSGWSVLVDNTPPTLTYDVSGTQGSNNWYVGDAALTVSGTDATSGLDKAEIKIDSGGWVANADSITTDGSYSVTFQTTDNVGNTASQTVTVNRDTVDPTFALNNGNNIIGSGQINFSGTANDATSGVASIKISFDNGNTWQTVPVSSNWTYDWDTRSEGNGDYKLKFIVVDKAGHTITQGPWTVTVDNNLPQIVMNGACINNWETLDFSVSKGNLDIGKITLTIAGRTYDNPTNPFVWDQRDDSNTYIDTPGDYTVTLTAYDSANNSSTATGCITIHAPIAPAVIIETSTSESDDSSSGGDSTVVESTPEPTETPVPFTSTPTNNLKESGEIITTTTLKTGKEQTEIVRGPLTFQNFIAQAAQQFQQQSIAANAPIWGNAALAAAAAATAVGLANKRRREEEERRLAEKAQREREAYFAQRKAFLEKLAGERRTAAFVAQAKLQAEAAAKKGLQSPPPNLTFSFDVDAINARLAAGLPVLDAEMEYLESVRADQSAKFKHGMEAWEADQVRQAEWNAMGAAAYRMSEQADYSSPLLGQNKPSENTWWENALISTANAWWSFDDAILEPVRSALVTGWDNAVITSRFLLGRVTRPFGIPDYRGIEQADFWIDKDAQFSWQDDYIVPTVTGDKGKYLEVNINGIEVPNTIVASAYALEAQGYNRFTDTPTGGWVWIMKSYNNFVENSPWVDEYNNFVENTPWINKYNDFVREIPWIGTKVDVNSIKTIPLGGSGFGPGQYSDEAMELLGLGGQDQTDPLIAQQAIGIKTASYYYFCQDCAPQDKLIVAAMGHTDNFLTPELVRMAATEEFMTLANGGINWPDFINNRIDPSKQSIFQTIASGGQHYSSQYLVKAYLKDMIELHESNGWELPYGLEVNEIRDLIDYVDSWEIDAQNKIDPYKTNN